VPRPAGLDADGLLISTHTGWHLGGDCYYMVFPPATDRSQATYSTTLPRPISSSSSSETCWVVDYLIILQLVHGYNW